MPAPKYTDEDIHRICKEFEKSNLSAREVSDKLGINIDFIYRILSGEKGKEISSKYKFKRDILAEEERKDLPGEIWKDVKSDLGNETKYLVSNKGRVKNKENGNIISQSSNNNGYKLVNVSFDGMRFHRQVHRLVAKAFIPNPENKPEVNHIDFNPSNNNLENLEWVTGKENIRHSKKAGRMVDPPTFYGEDNPVSKYTDSQIHQVCKLLASGITSHEKISKLTGVKASYITDIRRGKTRQDISKQYNLEYGSQYRYSDEEKMAIQYLYDKIYLNKEIFDIMRPMIPEDKVSDQNLRACIKRNRHTKSWKNFIEERMMLYCLISIKMIYLISCLQIF